MALNGVPYLKKKYKDTVQEVSFNGLMRLANNEQSADFTIVCGEREWRVHRAVLIIHSPTLAVACTGPFKESEARKLDLSDDEEDVVDCMIQFLYYLHYDYTPKVPGEARDEAILFDLKMAILADKYDIPQLTKLANGNAALRIGWWKPLNADVFARVIGLTCQFESILSDVDQAIRMRLEKPWDFVPDHPVKKALLEHPELMLRTIMFNVGKVEEAEASHDWGFPGHGPCYSAY